MFQADRAPRAPALIAAFLGLISSVRADERLDHFESRVRPVLVERCLGCHGAEAQKGGLRLDSRAGWVRGGDQGAAIEPGKPDESLLITAIRHEDESLRMPPQRKLAAHEIEALVEWVRAGALDPRDAGATRLGGMTLEAARSWWSLQPVTRPPVPGARPGEGSFSNPIDAFLGARLGESRLRAEPAADRRTLLRRLSYDLTGLPPTPEEVRAFVADASPDAVERVVDRLLASPRYGERWGRHWLDLVRYADTAGDNSDHPVPDAWRYRNWVLRAFNDDMPFDAFVREQIAGDILAAEGDPEAHADRVVATGFLAIARRFGHDIDKDIHLTHEDSLDTLGKAFLGLTLGCARCHSHKYDPISAEDYYALYGILDSTRFAFPGCEPIQQPRDLVALEPESAWQEALGPYQAELAQVDAGLAALDEESAAALGDWIERVAATAERVAEGQIGDGESGPLVSGEVATEATTVIEPGDVLLLTVGPQGSHGADTTRVEWEIAELGGGGRTWDVTGDLVDRFLAGNPSADLAGSDRVWWLLDLRGPRLLEEPIAGLSGNPDLHVWRNGDTPSALVNAASSEIRVWTGLRARSFFVHPAVDGAVGVAWRSPIGGRVAVRGTVADAHPGGPDGVAWTVERIPASLGARLDALVGIASRARDLRAARAAIEARRPAREFAYGVTEGTPHDVRLQLRGDPEKPGAVVARRWLEILGGQPVAGDAGSGRRQLADWIASRDNPLTARVIVNRVWQHHFGQGIVRTPNDFGARGQPPSHPELLNWLTSRFLDSGWRLKPLHRLIVLSEAYGRSSLDHDPALVEADPENLLLGRFERRRLTAEELRDSLLRLGGGLDDTPGGAHPFPASSTWNYTQHNPFSAAYPSSRRSVYLLVQRTRRDPFFALFDGADPNATTPERQETTVPTQALYFLNAPFFHDQCAAFADRILANPEAGDRIDSMFGHVLQRAPDAEERAWAGRFLERYGAEVSGEPESARTRQAFAALARVLLSSNEFLYLD